MSGESQNMPDWKLDDLPQTLVPALRIFLRELDSHILHFRRTVQQIAEIQSQNTISNGYLKELKSLAHRFHTIKGGAGFFKLKQIHGYADQLEKLFGTNSQFSSEESIKEELSAAIEELQIRLNEVYAQLDESPPSSER